MATLEPWFLGLLCALGAVIVILLIVIVIFCIRWSRKDRKRSKKKAQAAARHTSFRDIVAEQEKQDPTLPRARNSNWLMREAPNGKPATEQNGVRKISGQEPFIVGSSLIPFSQELDKSRDSLAYQQPPPQNDFKASGNEERMVQLGRIPPRPAFPRTESDLSGKRPGLVHKRASEGHNRSSSGEVRMSFGPESRPRTAEPQLGAGRTRQAAAGNAVDMDMSGIDDDTGWVSLRDTEMQIWQKSGSGGGGRVNEGYRPYALPKEDYDLAGATWYEKPPNSLEESHVKRMKEVFSSPRRGDPQSSGRLSPTLIPRSNSAVDHRVADPSKRFSAGLELPDIWQRVPEDPDDVKRDKLKRARRVGVPILPD